VGQLVGHDGGITPSEKHAVNPWSSQLRLEDQIITKISLLAAACVFGLAPTVASTQSTLTCADFVRNPNGSWSPVRPITLNGITMGPGVAFMPGVAFGGIDLASVLNQQCK
jgi:hypothetical protein